MTLAVRVPASSANLGPGFDALGMALTLHLEIEVGVERGRLADGHPAEAAFRAVGGEGPIAVRSAIPMGRGLGFSGAARVAGLLAGLVQRTGIHDRSPHEAEVLARVSELEGHADNGAASLFGGVVATAAGRCVGVPLGFDPAVVVWVPGTTTSTDESRTRLGRAVSFPDAVFQIGRTALLVAAFAAGAIDALHDATQDRLHQDARFERSPASRRALDTLLQAGAWCGWLSGSGPTVAALCDRAQATAVAGALDGTKILSIDRAGATITS